jgi:predicted RNase H-like nuclease
MVAFVGLDLAWTARNPTGICVITFDGKTERLDRLDALPASVDDFTALCASYGHDVVAAIDAPLLVTDERVAERALARAMGGQGVYAYTATTAFLAKFGADAGPRLGVTLAEAGFCLDPSLLRLRGAGRYAFEVYPHATHVRLFGLAGILKYKKGRIALRREGLLGYQRELRTYLERQLPWMLGEPAVVSSLAPDAIEARGRDLKRLEDTLDGLTCALVARHAWLHGPAGYDVFGAHPGGYILVPIVPR